MKKVFSAILLALCLTSPLAAAAAEEPTEYVVTKGDTMWGLSERFFKDPHYWPDLWAKNPSITNPHFIYPGQKLRFYADRVEAVPAEAETAPTTPQITVPAEVAIPEKIFRITAGEVFVDQERPPKAGEIVATNENRVVVGAGDYVYTDIGSDKGGKVGAIYSVFKDDGAVSHPVKSYIVGNRFIQLGTIQLIEVNKSSSRAKVTQSYLEVSRDSFLTPYQPTRREIPLKKAAKEVSGYIVGTRKTNRLIGEGETVFLDIGTKDGLQLGNLLYCVREMVGDSPEFLSKKLTLPLQVMGAVVVVRVGESTATGLIMKSAGPMEPGDRVVTAPGQ